MNSRSGSFTSRLQHGGNLGSPNITSSPLPNPTYTPRLTSIPQTDTSRLRLSSRHTPLPRVDPSQINISPRLPDGTLRPISSALRPKYSHDSDYDLDSDDDEYTGGRTCPIGGTCGNSAVGAPNLTTNSSLENLTVGDRIVLRSLAPQGINYTPPLLSTSSDIPPLSRLPSHGSTSRLPPIVSSSSNIPRSGNIRPFTSNVSNYTPPLLNTSSQGHTSRLSPIVNSSSNIPRSDYIRPTSNVSSPTYISPSNNTVQTNITNRNLSGGSSMGMMGNTYRTDVGRSSYSPETIESSLGGAYSDLIQQAYNTNLERINNGEIYPITTLSSVSNIPKKTVSPLPAPVSTGSTNLLKNKVIDEDDLIIPDLKVKEFNPNYMGSIPTIDYVEVDRLGQESRR